MTRLAMGLVLIGGLVVTAWLAMVPAQQQVFVLEAPMATAIAAPWFAGELTPQMRAALTVSSPAPTWLWIGIGVGVLIGVALMIGVRMWTGRSA